MNNPLHIQKIKILTRLVKEESITLSEALILLKEEDMEKSSSENLLESLNASQWCSNSTNTVINFDENSN